MIENASLERQRQNYERAVEAVRPNLMARALTALPLDQAEDAVQQALVIALSNANWFEIVRPGSWLLGVLDYVILAINRKKKAASFCDVSTEIEEADPCEIVVEEIGAAQILAAQVAAVAAAMDKADLTAREFAVLGMKLAGKENPEIGAALDLEQNAVRSYLSLAIRKVRPHICAPAV